MPKFIMSMRRLGMAALILLAAVAGYHCGKSGEIPITTDSQEARELFVRARELAENLHLDEAVELLSRAITLDPEFALAYLYRGRYVGEPQYLKQDLQRAMEMSAGVSAGEQAVINAYQAYYGENDPAKTLEYYEQVVDMFPKDKRAHFRLGIFCRNLGQYDRAVEHLHHAIALDADFAPAHLELGYTFLDSREYDASEKAFQEYIRLIPDQPNPYDSLADLYSIKGEFEKAVEYYREALEKDPDFGDSQRKIGVNLVFLDRYEEGRNAIRKALTMERTPEGKAENMCMLTRTYLYEADFPSALEAADECIRFGTENGVPGQVVRNYLAKCAVHAELGELDQAEECMTICKNIFENADLPGYFRDMYSDSMYFWEAFLAAKQKDFQRAVGIANDFRLKLELSPNPDRMVYHFALLGCIELEREAPEIAREYFRYAEIEEPLVLYYSAVAESRAGNPARAALLFRRAANWNQDDLWYAFIRRKALTRR